MKKILQHKLFPVIFLIIITFTALVLVFVFSEKDVTPLVPATVAVLGIAGTLLQLNFNRQNKVIENLETTLDENMVGGNESFEKLVKEISELKIQNFKLQNEIHTLREENKKLNLSILEIQKENAYFKKLLNEFLGQK